MVSPGACQSPFVWRPSPVTRHQFVLFDQIKLMSVARNFRLVYLTVAVAIWSHFGACTIISATYTCACTKMRRNTVISTGGYRGTLLDKISVDESAEYLARCREFCPPKFCPIK